MVLAWVTLTLCILTQLHYYYRPQRSCGQGYVFTRVCDSVHRGGCLPQCMLGYPPGADTPQSRHPPRADTPPEQTPPQSRHPQEQTPPIPLTPPGSRLWHMVNEQPVRILLECILVYIYFCSLKCYSLLSIKE